MDKNPTINVLILTDLLTQGEQLVSALRRSGFSVHAESVRDELWLRDRLASHGWDLLLLDAASIRIPAQRLQIVLTELQPDLVCVAIGSAAATAALRTRLPQAVLVPDITDPGNTEQASRLQQLLERELGHLQTRRQWSRSSRALVELQEQHQLLLATTSEAVAYLHDGMHVYVNPAYASLLGQADPSALLNSAFLDLVCDSSVEEAREFLRHCQQQHDHGERRIYVRDINGLALQLSLQCNSIIYQQERALQVILRTAGKEHKQILSPPHSTTLSLESADVIPARQQVDDLALQQCLQRALLGDDARLLFQPLVSFSADSLEHYAASIELDGYNLASMPILTAACRLGLAEKLDRLLLQTCLKRLREQKSPDLRLVMKLSQASMMNTGFPQWLQQQLLEPQIQSTHVQSTQIVESLTPVRCLAERLVLQISELDIVDSPAGCVETFCRQLQALQIPLALTHFGGSLEPFNHLPAPYATYVELDPALIDGVLTDGSKLARLREATEQLRSRGLLSIASVDSMALLPTLWASGIDIVRSDCLWEASSCMDFSFVREQEITLAALH